MEAINIIKFFQIIKFIYRDNYIDNKFEIIKGLNIDNKEDIEKLLTDYEKLNIFFKKDKLKVIKFLYFNREIIHNILYENENTIELKPDEDIINLSFYFYLSLLIRDKDIVNYTYSFEFIKNINNQQNNNNNIYNKLILSKIILELIDNYEQTDKDDNNNDLEMEKIKNYNNETINNNIKIINELDLNWSNEKIKSMNIDIIYINIILSLIKKNKLDNYEYTLNIIKQLEIEYIDITKTMFDEIKCFLENEKIIVNKYYIQDIEDLFNIQNINFYYILVKYILKNPIYIYQINLLIKIRNNILKINKKNSIIIYLNNINTINNDIKERLINLLKLIIDSDFFIVKANNYNIINNKNNDIYSNENKNINDKKDESSKNKEEEEKEKNKIKEENVTFNNSSEVIENSSVNISNRIINSSEVIENSSVNKSNNTINSSEVLENSSHNKSNNNLIIDNNILSSYENQQLSSYSSNKNVHLSKNESIENNEIISSKKTEEIQTDKDRKISSFLSYLKCLDFDIDKKNKNYNIDFIKEISDIFICYGANINLIVYNKEYKNISKKENISNYIYNVFELKDENGKENNKKILNLLISSKKILYLYTLDKKNINKGLKYKTEFNLLNKGIYSKILSLIQINNKFLFCNENEVIMLNDIFSKTIQIKRTHMYYNLFIKGIIKINEYLLLFKSNKIASKGKDELLFYNIVLNKEIDNNIKNEMD